MSAKIGIVATVGMVLLLAAASAAAGKLGVIGDSLSTAMDADDGCSGVADCLPHIRQDRDYSFADGVQLWSIASRLVPYGLTGTVSAARNGAGWNDALEQAQAVLADPEVVAVLIELGGKDVCQRLGEPLPDLAQIEAEIDDTLSYLTDRLGRGRAIALAEVPEVSHLREAVAERPHFLFSNCQALWDIDVTALNPAAVDEVCAFLLGSVLCSSPSVLAQVEQRMAEFILRRIVPVMGGAFTCSNALGSASSAAEREAARRFNADLNALLARKAAEYRQRNGVHVLLIGNVDEHRYDSAEVSALDCFHPSRLGQEIGLADTFWSVIGAVLGETSP